MRLYVIVQGSPRALLLIPGSSIPVAFASQGEAREYMDELPHKLATSCLIVSFVEDIDEVEVIDG